MKGQLRCCAVCGRAPVAMAKVDYCFTCWPGGPVVPPPCLRCGSTSHYFTSGLCIRCHHGARPGVDSCLDCYAWGATRHLAWRCIGCDRWRQLRKLGTCPSCGRTELPLNPRDGGCRLCRKQRSQVLAIRPRLWPIPDLIEANRYGQQLFFADMFNFPRSPDEPPVPAPEKIDPIVPVAWHQQVLFDWPWDLEAGRRCGFPSPPNLRLAAALAQAVDDHGARYGWSAGHRHNVRRGVRILLGIQDTPGAVIRYSEVFQLAQIGLSVPAVAAVLADVGMLHDDRAPAIVAWFSRQIGDLPPDMRDELGVWFDVMRHGSATPPRRLPRSDATLRSQLHSSLPALRTWAQTHPSLREIAREDVYAALPPNGAPRALMLQGLRSIFRVLKGRQLVFVNPTARMRGPAQDHPAPRPVDVPALRAALNSDDPTRAALAALLGFHAVRIKNLRLLHLTDLRDGRLHVDDHVILLARPALDRLAAYLDFRARCWPNTINPHLFINRRSNTHTRPVCIPWIANTLGMAPQTIRRDRILDEAFATSGDLRQISDMFGISVAQAYRFASYVHCADVAIGDPG